MSTSFKVFPYPCLITKLSKEDGGGFMVEFPDLNGCASKGDTWEEMIDNGNEAISLWLDAIEDDDDDEF